MPIILARGRQKQEGHQELEARLVYLVKLSQNTLSNQTKE